MVIPFETAYTDLVSLVGTLPLLLGMAFAGVALLHRESVLRLLQVHSGVLPAMFLRMSSSVRLRLPCMQVQCSHGFLH